MSPLRVLVIEDEAPVALLVEEAVEAAGHVVALTASNIVDGMRAATSADFDVALLDLNLHGQKAHAIPVTLAARSKPFAFVTGYGRAGLLHGFAGVPVIAKPFSMDEVADALSVLQSRFEHKSASALD